MAVPRPVLFALLGIALCAAAFMATRGAREPGGSVTAVPAPVPAPAAKPKAANQHRTHAASKAGSPSAYAAAANQGTKHAAPAPAKPHTNAAAKHGAGTKPATTQPAQPGSQPAANPVAERVKRALADGKVVVFFFTHAGAADDTATREAVRTLHRMRRVVVVKAGLDDLSTYSPVLSGAGVSQVPSVVVVHGNDQARLIEGYVDPGTLRQTVADALR